MKWQSHLKWHMLSWVGINNNAVWSIGVFRGLSLSVSRSLPVSMFCCVCLFFFAFRFKIHNEIFFQQFHFLGTMCVHALVRECLLWMQNEKNTHTQSLDKQTSKKHKSKQINTHTFERRPSEESAIRWFNRSTSFRLPLSFALSLSLAPVFSVRPSVFIFFSSHTHTLYIRCHGFFGAIWFLWS